MTGSQYLIDDYPTTIQSSSWVILDYSIVQSDLATAFVDGDLISYKYPTGLLQRTKNLVYSNGKTKIYQSGTPSQHREEPPTGPHEGMATGVAYGAGLWCGGACWLPVSVRHWSCRTGTACPGCGPTRAASSPSSILAVSLCTSGYLRLRRKEPNPSAPSAQARRPLAAAIARTVALLSTVLVVYLSVNTVTHRPHWPGMPPTLRAGPLKARSVFVLWLCASSP